LSFLASFCQIAEASFFKGRLKGSDPKSSIGALAAARRGPPPFPSIASIDDLLD
jgi:hypothetical protein